MRSDTIPARADNDQPNPNLNLSHPPKPIHNESTIYYINIRKKGVRAMSVSVEGWLPALVSNNRFFTPCSKCSDCHSARESSLNYWDIDTKEELCSICLQKEPRENVLQVRFGGLGRGQIHSRYFLIHFSFYGILNMRIIVVIGSSIIVS
jgi:hypothetical protein